ncbi:MAG: hypothetical protein RL562_3358, partial [Planctomycetota bacterium]
PDMAALVMRMLEKVPGDRPATAAEVRAELEAIRRKRHADVPRARLRTLFRDEIVLDTDGAGSVFVSQQVTVAVPRQGTSSAPVVPTQLRDTPLEPSILVPAGGAALVAGQLPDDAAPGARHADTVVDVALQLTPAPGDSDADGGGQTHDESAVATREEDLTSGSQGLVRIPSPRVLEAAIEARRRALEARDAARHEADTRVEIAEDQRRLAQQAPPGADDVEGRGRKSLGSRTILGTGVPGKPRRTSGSDDPAA